MEKIKLLTIAVFALLLLNLGTLGFLVFSKPPGNRMHGLHGEPKDIIIRKLQLDKGQQEKYENLIAWHRHKISSIEEQIHTTKNKLYLQLLQPDVDTNAKDSLIATLSSCQAQIEDTHFTHFQDIRKICRPDQINNYNALTEELSRLFSKPPNPGHD